MATLQDGIVKNAALANNSFTKSVASQIINKRRLPKRLELLGTVAKNPGGFVKTLRAADKAAVAAGTLKTGKGRFGQLGEAVINSETARTLTISTGGLAGSIAGNSVAGPLAGVAGDNIGTAATRKGLNAVYATYRSLKKRKTRKDKGIKRVFGAMNRLDRMKGENLGDHAGWAIGNATAAAVPVPLGGAAVASATVPSIVKNVKKVQKGELTPGQFLKATASDVGEKLNLKKHIKKGNARERWLRGKIDKVIRTGKFRYQRTRIISLNPAYSYSTIAAFRQASSPKKIRQPKSSKPKTRPRLLSLPKGEWAGSC